MAMKNCLLTCLLFMLTIFMAVPGYAQVISLHSDNPKLANTFNWAVQKALSFRVTGQKINTNYEIQPLLGHQENVPAIPSYWAGYFSRTAFYARDFAHGSPAAHFVGMDAENFSMFEAFAKHCTADKKWFSWWALNFDGSVYTLDAPNPPGDQPYEGYPADFLNPKGESFVREIPAMFDLVFRAYQCYLWTGDKRYLTNPHLFNMFEKVLNEFIGLHDADGNQVPEGKGSIWEGSATYNERNINPKEAGDEIAVLYQAQLAYAGFLAAAGEKEKARQATQKAADLYDYFNREWSDIPGDSLYSCAVLQDGSKYSKFNKETSFLMPLYLITAPGQKTDHYLDFIEANIGSGFGKSGAGPEAPENIESYTYLPELFFQYNRVDAAYRYMNYIIDILEKPHEVAAQGNNGNYPEISFMLLRHIVEGMMGVSPDAPGKMISTIPRLPADTKQLELSNLQIGQQHIDLVHTGNKGSSLHYKKGVGTLSWEAAFYGSFTSFLVNGKKIEAKHKKLNGELISYIVLTLKQGQSRMVNAVQ